MRVLFSTASEPARRKACVESSEKSAANSIVRKGYMNVLLSVESRMTCLGSTHEGRECDRRAAPIVACRGRPGTGAEILRAPYGVTMMRFSTLETPGAA